MTNPLTWFNRMEETRKRNGLSVDRLLERLVMSRAAYYDYRSNPARRPRSPETIDRIAAFLGEDPAALSAEMAPVAGPPPTAFLEAAAARELNTRLFQQHVRALAHVLGMSGSSRNVDGIDIVVRLLREPPPESAGSATGLMTANLMNPVVAVVPRSRGNEHREERYQYQIYVIPQELAGPSPSAPADVLPRTMARVDEVMNGAMLPVTREHSTELALPLFQGRSDVLLYPGLLEMRAPEPLMPRQGEDETILVTGVYYAGAPDVAALLARELRFGFSTFDQLARLQARGGMRGLPSGAFRRTIAGVAHAVLADQSPTSGPMVWATDDPEALLTAPARADVANFPGPLVVLALTDEALDYAAYRVGCVDAACPDAGAQAENRRWLQRQQDELLAVARTRDPRQRTIVKVIGLPAEARRRPDRTYPDAVDAMFDQYVRTERAVSAELRLETVLAAQIERLERRVAGGNDVYAAERAEIRTAARRVTELREQLKLGRFLGPVGHAKAKPQFLLLFDSPDGPVVLKTYGRVRPGEALTQRLWRQHGVRVVDVVGSGDEPTSWLLMEPLAVEPDGVGADLIATTTELAGAMAQAHRVGTAQLRDDPEFAAPLSRLDAAVTTHLGSVLTALDRHGYPVPGDWPELVRELCGSLHPSLLHGDLGGGNVVRDRDDDRLWILDACGYVGPAEFDAARWAARTGGAEGAGDVLDAWLTVETGLDTALARALLGLELLMEAGVREIVKDEQRRPADFPDAGTQGLLDAADRLLGELRRAE